MPSNVVLRSCLNNRLAWALAHSHSSADVELAIRMLEGDILDNRVESVFNVQNFLFIRILTRDPCCFDKPSIYDPIGMGFCFGKH